MLTALMSRIARVRMGGITVSFPSVENEIEAIRAETETAKADDAQEREYLLLREYHAQGLAQAKVSFWFSMMFASFGFGLIVYAVARSSEQTPAVVSLIAGAVVDAVAGLFSFNRIVHRRRCGSSSTDCGRIDASTTHCVLRPPFPMRS